MEFLAFFLINVVKVLKYALLARILLSWIQPMGGGRFSQMLNDVTEPMLKIFRSFLPNLGMIDLSPLVAFFALDLVEMGILKVFASL
jgi:YggT family protein